MGEGSRCKALKADGERCEADAECSSQVCWPYDYNSTGGPIKICKRRQPQGSCCKAGWVPVDFGLRSISKTYCCPPGYEARKKMKVNAMDKPALEDMPFWGCYRSFGGPDTLSEASATCSNANAHLASHASGDTTISLSSITSKEKAAQFTDENGDGFWTSNSDIGSFKPKFVEEAYEMHPCSTYVAEDFRWGALLTASEVPVKHYCQKLGCSAFQCLKAIHTCNSKGQRTKVAYACGSPDNVADMGVAFLIFVLVIILTVVGLCVAPCFMKGDTKVVPA